MRGAASTISLTTTSAKKQKKKNTQKNPTTQKQGFLALWENPGHHPRRFFGARSKHLPEPRHRGDDMLVCVAVQWFSYKQVGLYFLYCSYAKIGTEMKNEVAAYLCCVLSKTHTCNRARIEMFARGSCKQQKNSKERNNLQGTTRHQDIVFKPNTEEADYSQTHEQSRVWTQPIRHFFFKSI